ncbi:hypothetical protein K469DRAFT_564483, partial [Zopfia rhizophila CBS 207.26]
VGVLRFAIFVPFGVYVNFAKSHWNTIKIHDLLQGAPYSPLIAKGERLAATWGEFGFYWNFAVWIPAIIIPAPFSLVFGIVDLAVAVMIGILTNLQTGYAPHSRDKCAGSGPHYWQLTPGTNESFFEASARLNATKTSAGRMCKSYVEEWKYGVTLSFFYTLIAATNIIISVILCVIAARESRRRQRSFREWLLEAIISFPRFIAVVLYLLWCIPVAIFRCLPIGIKSRTRYTRRIAVKTGQRLSTPHEIKLRKLRPNHPVMRYQGGDGGEPTGLADFLGVYDILMLVAENLHYTDIVNLSLVSKSIREAVLPVADYDRRLNHFKMYTCQARSRKQCWVCTNQICKKCKHFRALKQTTSYFHLDTCQPYCSSCYFTHIQLPPQPRVDPRVCRCAPPSPTPSFLQRLFHDKQYFINAQHTKHVTRMVCRECNRYLDSELLENREKRTRAELRNPGREGKCVKCEKWIKGVKWWVCGNCKKECVARCHAPWGKKGKSGGQETQETV